MTDYTSTRLQSGNSGTHRAPLASREELLKEGVKCLLSVALATGKAVLHDYINATICAVGTLNRDVC